MDKKDFEIPGAKIIRQALISADFESGQVDGLKVGEFFLSNIGDESQFGYIHCGGTNLALKITPNAQNPVEVIADEPNVAYIKDAIKAVIRNTYAAKAWDEIETLKSNGVGGVKDE